LNDYTFSNTTTILLWLNVGNKFSVFIEAKFESNVNEIEQTSLMPIKNITMLRVSSFTFIFNLIYIYQISIITFIFIKSTIETKLTNKHYMLNNNLFSNKLITKGSNLPLPSFKVSWIVMVDKSRWKISTSSIIKNNRLSFTIQFSVSENVSKLIGS
jgi:hypothetical protein